MCACIYTCRHTQMGKCWNFYGKAVKMSFLLQLRWRQPPGVEWNYLVGVNIAAFRGAGLENRTHERAGCWAPGCWQRWQAAGCATASATVLSSALSLSVWVACEHKTGGLLLKAVGTSVLWPTAGTQAEESFPLLPCPGRSETLSGSKHTHWPVLLDFRISNSQSLKRLILRLQLEDFISVGLT